MSSTLICLLVLVGIVASTLAGPTEVLKALQKLHLRDTLTDDDRKILKTAKVNDLPLSVKRMVEKIPSGANVCCRNIPTTVMTKSRSARRVNTHATNYRDGSSHCGTWGWHRCAKYATKYREVVTYTRVYYKESVKGKCPEKDVVCCHLYINVSGRCVNIHDLSKVTANLVG